MSSRIVIANRVVWSSPDCNRINWRKGVPRTNEGKISDCAQAIPSSNPRSPFRVGAALWDKEEEIVYRVIARADPSDGWAVSEYWQNRWRVDHKAICSFVSAGFLDASIEEKSVIKRYRCRDEWRLRDSDLMRKARKRMKNKRWNSKRSMVAR